MNYDFDSKGFLKPYQKNQITLNQFEDIFVNSFKTSNTRRNIFNDYMRFLNEFQSQVTTDFVQWIDGSFVTKKENPNDLDFVNLIDFDIYEKNEKLIESKFRKKNARIFFGKIDSYFVKNFPKDHKKHFITEFDLVYWRNWFSETKKNRLKEKFPKGFLEIKFNS